jgi:succinate dehydrogenase/fumarate reductase flavoprotein subunit
LKRVRLNKPFALDYIIIMKFYLGLNELERISKDYEHVKLMSKSKEWNNDLLEALELENMISRLF